MRIAAVHASPLSVPMREPFVIASARMDVTRAALVEVALEDPQSGQCAHGLGEAAALPPVTAEDQPDVLAAIARAAPQLAGASVSELARLGPVLDAAFPAAPVARAGLECALLDAWARLAGQPVCALLGGAPRPLITDITLPISEPARMAELAAEYRAAGFRSFKVKVGKALEADLRALQAVHARVNDACYRLDANGGFTAREALELLAHTRSAGLAVECFEQPCARSDLDGMAQVARDGGVPVIADESLRSDADLTQLLATRAAHGVNLKLAKLGGPLTALALGRRARAHGLSLMCGGMVETRLGIAAMAHVACALPAVEYVDLDTAFLLASDPFHGGYVDLGPRLELTAAPGWGVGQISAAPR